MRINEAAWLEKYNRWQIKVQKDGVRKTFTSSKEGKKGKIECEKKADKWLNGGAVDTTIRFNKAYQMFLEEKQELTGTDNYSKLMSVGKNWLLPELEHRKLSSITSAQLQQIIKRAYKAGRAKKTLEGIKGTISTFATFCRKQGWEFCSIEFVQIPKGATKKVKTILQPNEIQSVFEDTDTNNLEYYIHAFRFLILTGLRRGELCGLMNDDINGSVAYIKRSINRLNEVTEGKTINAQRPVALCMRATQVLDDQKTMLKRMGIISPYVFPDRNGHISNSNNLYKCWYNYRSKIGVNCSLHELRHTLISYASANMPEALLKKNVGHSKSMDTGIYIHNVEDETRHIASLLDKRFNGIL